MIKYGVVKEELVESEEEINESNDDSFDKRASDLTEKKLNGKKDTEDNN